MSKVEDGTQLVDEAGTTMEEIVNAVKRVTDIMGEITAASLEQSQGIEQANQAISSMDTVTQQNAALVEEAAASAELMQEQSEDLIKAVMVFKLSGSARAPSAQRSKRKQPNANVTELPVQQRSKPQANDLNNSTSAQPRKAASGGDTSWEEF